MTSPAAYAIAPDVGEVHGGVDKDGGSVIYAAKLPVGPPYVMPDSGAVIWCIAREGGTLEQITSRVAAAYGVEVEVVSVHVAAFLDDLVTRGLLVQTS